jgi:KDO2-lipid IV(A) lauroyltransferase
VNARHFWKLFLRAAIYILVRPVAEIFRIMPPRMAAGTGNILGALAATVLPWFSRIAEANLARAFPDLPAGERSRIAAANFRHLGRELGRYLSLTRRDTSVLKSLVRVEGRDLVDKALARGRGVVVLTAHLGSWEIAGAYVGLTYQNFAVVARDLYDTRLNALLNGFRARFNIRVYDTSDARGILRHLKNGGILAVLVDQNSRRVASVPVPFFGLPAPTPVGPVRLVERTGAALMMGFLVRVGEGYRLRLEELGTADGGAAERWLEIFNLRLETLIREHPDQWVWMHDRWAARPSADGVGGLSRPASPAAGEAS